MPEAYIVGGGYSLSNFNFEMLREKETFVINKSLFSVPNPKNFVTVDYTAINKIGLKHLQHSSAKKYFIVDMSHPFLRRISGKYVDTRFNLIYQNLFVFDTIVEAVAQEGFGYTFEDFRTGLNSGYCALQLAIVLGYTKIYLLGFDLCIKEGRTHHHGGYGEAGHSFNRKLQLYLDKFRSGIQQLNNDGKVHLFSCSQISRLNDLIPYVNIGDCI